jgi:hypothetical protein
MKSRVEEIFELISYVIGIASIPIEWLRLLNFQSQSLNKKLLKNLKNKIFF